MREEGRMERRKEGRREERRRGGKDGRAKERREGWRKRGREQGEGSTGGMKERGKAEEKGRSMPSD